MTTVELEAAQAAPPERWRLLGATLPDFDRVKRGVLTAPGPVWVHVRLTADAGADVLDQLASGVMATVREQLSQVQAETLSTDPWIARWRRLLAGLDEAKAELQEARGRVVRAESLVAAAVLEGGDQAAASRELTEAKVAEAEAAEKLRLLERSLRGQVMGDNGEWRNPLSAAADAVRTAVEARAAQLRTQAQAELEQAGQALADAVAQTYPAYVRAAAKLKALEPVSVAEFCTLSQ